MTLYEFNMLDTNEKYQITWDLGTHIETLITDKYRIVLYAISKFFVEVYYNPDNNKLEEIKSFKHGHSLNKYVGSIPF